MREAFVQRPLTNQVYLTTSFLLAGMKLCLVTILLARGFDAKYIGQVDSIIRWSPLLTFGIGTYFFRELALKQTDFASIRLAREYLLIFVAIWVFLLCVAALLALYSVSPAYIAAICCVPTFSLSLFVQRRYRYRIGLSAQSQMQALLALQLAICALWIAIFYHEQKHEEELLIYPLCLAACNLVAVIIFALYHRIFNNIFRNPNVPSLQHLRVRTAHIMRQSIPVVVEDFMASLIFLLPLWVPTTNISAAGLVALSSYLVLGQRISDIYITRILHFYAKGYFRKVAQHLKRSSALICMSGLTPLGVLFFARLLGVLGGAEIDIATVKDTMLWVGGSALIMVTHNYRAVLKTSPEGLRLSLSISGACLATSWFFIYQGMTPYLSTLLSSFGLVMGISFCFWRLLKAEGKEDK